MPLLLTPRQFSQRADLYHQLSTLISAGISLPSALGMARDARLSRSFSRPLQRVIAAIEEGATFSDALQTAAPRWLPAFDVALVQAGETSGRLDLCCRYLSEYYSECGRLLHQVFSDLAYPVFVLHFAILLFPVSLLTRLVLQGEAVPFIMAKAAILLPLYGGVFLLLYLGRANHAEFWRRWAERAMQWIPILGKAWAQLALARLSIALESLLNAGVTIIEAWELAAAASGSPALRRTVLQWRQDVLAGQTPAEAVRASGRFPDLFVSLYATGEVSGQLDSTLHRLYRHYQDEAIAKFRAMAQWMPRLLYLIIMLVIARQIIAFWSGYFSQINEITG